MMLDRISENNKLVIIEFKNIVLLMMVLIDFMFIGVMILNPVYSYNEPFFIRYDLFVCILLFLNLLYEYYNSKEDTISFIKHHILDILAMIPYNFLFLRYFASSRIFQIAQIINIFKIYSVRENYTGSFKYFVHNRLLKVISLLLICYLIMASIMLTQVDGSFTSIFDSFWYNIVTIASVGYGDITPVSMTGKLIGILTIILGIMFVSVFTAAMSSIYMEKNEEDTRRQINDKVHDLKVRMDSMTERMDNIESDINELNDKMDTLIEKIDRK